MSSSNYNPENRLFFVVALAGYIYNIHKNTKTLDNIFLNFSSNSHIMMIGRTGYAFTILFGLPLVILPCRNTLLSIPSQFKSLQRYGPNKTSSPVMLSPRDTLHEMSPLLYVYNMSSDRNQQSRRRILQSLASNSASKKKADSNASEFIHRIWITFAIVCVCLVFAVGKYISHSLTYANACISPPFKPNSPFDSIYYRCSRC